MSPATISRILRRLGLNRLPALEPAERRGRFSSLPPGLNGITDFFLLRYRTRSAHWPQLQGLNLHDNANVSDA